MSTFDLLAQQLSSADSDVKIRLKAAIQLLANIERYVSGPIYAEFLKTLVPIFTNCLKGPPVFTSTSPEQKLQICILNILYQLPKNPPGPLEPCAEDVVDLFKRLVRTDNEKNASLCIKMIIDIVPHQTNVLGDKFQPSLALIQHMFDQIQLVVMGSHNSMPGISPPGSSHTHEDSPQPGSSVASISDFGLGLQLQTLPLLQAMASLKVLAECPESRIQVYKSLASMDIKRFFLFIQSVLLLQAKPQEQDHVAAAAKGTIFTEVSLNTSSRPAFGEFIRTRVKALSTLACLLQYYGEQLLKLTEFKKFHPTLPPTIIQQLKDCPREKSGVRRELLMTTRHIINHKFRKLFLKHIDELLDERTLIGDGLTDYETQRLLAYSIIADLIHHVRDALKPPQIRKIVEVYTKNLQDNFPGIGFQTMSAKLLLDMAECIAKMPNKVDARYYLILILNAIGNTFAAIKQQHSNAIKLSKLYAQQSVDVSPYNYLAEKEPLPDWDEIDIFTATPIKTSNPLDRGADPVADNKFLFQKLINGLKDIFHQLKACQIGSSTRFTAEEVQVLSKLFCEGANVFCYYTGTESHYTNALELVADRYVFSTGEEKDLLQTFVAVLQYIDPTTLHEIFPISIALSRVPQLSEIFPTLVEQYRLQQFFRAEEWVDYLISVADIGDEWCDIRPLLSIIDAVLDNIYTIRNDAILARLYKYLNHFPKEVYSLLFSKIDEQKYGRFFAQLLQHPKSGPLRKVVAENVETMIKDSGDKSAEEDTRYTAQVYSIHVMYSVCKFKGDREWLDKKDVIMWFKMVGKNLEAHLRSNTLPPHLRLAAEQASEPLMVIFTKFLEYHPTDLDALFSLIDSVTNEDFSSTQPLSAYIYRHIICSNSIEYRKTIVLRSLEVCASKSASQKTKTFVLHNIVNAIIAMDVMRPSKQIDTKSPRLIDKAVIESIHIKFWKVGLGNSNDDLTQSSVEFTIMELLQLTAMLVKYYHSALQDTWQDIIKLRLTCLEDVVCKHAANVVLGYCIAHFETPTQTIRQVYTSLLGSSHHGGRALVTQALELIAPVLRNLYNAVPNDRNPFWVAIPLKILEGKDIQQTTTFFRFLVKHPDLFYDFRKSFIIYIVKSLRTIAQLPNPSTQSMQLVLQLMTLVLQWEQQRVEGRKFLSTEKHRFEDLDTSEYKIPTWARTEMINYLAEFIVSLREGLPPLSANAKAATASHPPIPPIRSVEMIKSMSLLHSLLHPEYWGDLDIDLSNIIETLLVGDPTDSKWVNSMINALQVVRIIADVKPHILKNMLLLKKLLERSRNSGNSEVFACLYDEADIIGLKMKSLLDRGSVS